MATEKVGEYIAIKPAKFQTLIFEVDGLSPYMQHAFSQKALLKMMTAQKAGSTARTKKEREPRDFEAEFEKSQHRSTEGWVGIPASAFRNACIDACRMVGFKMTHARMSIFIEADGLDESDGQPLVKLRAGKPEKNEMPVRLESGVVSPCMRPMWRKWGCALRVRFDADQFTASDIANLLERAGMQVGIGEGRPFSRNSNGLGFGTFSIVTKSQLG